MTAPDALPVRPELVGAEPYGAPQLDVAVRLNTNENPYGPSARVQARIVEAVAGAAADLNRYPDREALALRRDLAAYLGHGLGPEQVWAANGSNEVMVQLLQAFGGPGRCCLSFAPTYSMYSEYARDTFTRWVAGRRTDAFEIDVEVAVATIAAEAPDVVFLASPNNPTGTALPLSTIEEILEAAPGIVVVDEAYAEFRREHTPSALSLLADQPRLAVTRTMSKAFALAGGRVGYVAASPALIDALRVVRLPYHLSAVTQAVARAALASADEMLATVALLRLERDSLVTWLRDIGLTAVESDANFVLFGCFDDRRTVWEGLLDRGVLIRETGPDGWLRVSVGTPEEMTIFRAALVDTLQYSTPQEAGA